MAETIEKIIKIQTGGAEQTVKGLKDEITNLRDALLNVEKGSDDYKQIVEQLVDDQKRLSDTMNAGKTTIESAADSIVGLERQYKALYDTYKLLTDEQRNSDYGKNMAAELKGIHEKINETKMGVGNFKDNIGNYADSMTKAFGGIGNAAKGMISPIQGVDKALKLVAKNPILLVFTAIVAVIAKLVQAFKRNEQAMASLHKAMAPVQAIGVVLDKVFDALANTLGKAAEAVANFFGKLFSGNKDADNTVTKLQKITDAELALAKKTRENTMKNADLEKEAAELRAKAEDKNKYTAQERLEFIRQAGEKEAEIAQAEYESLKMEYELMVQKNSLSETSAEDKQKEAEAYAAMVKAQTTFLQKQKEINSKVAAFSQEIKNNAKAAKEARLTLEKELIQQQLELVQDGSEEQLRLAKELRKKELDIQLNGLKEKIKNRKQYQEAEKLAIQKFNKDVEDLEKENAQKRKKNEDASFQASVLNSSPYEKTKKTLLHNADELTQIIKDGYNKGINLTIEEFNNMDESQWKDALQGKYNSLFADVNNFINGYIAEYNGTRQSLIAKAGGDIKKVIEKIVSFDDFTKKMNDARKTIDGIFGEFGDSVLSSFGADLMDGWKYQMEQINTSLNEFDNTFKNATISDTIELFKKRLEELPPTLDDAIMKAREEYDIVDNILAGNDWQSFFDMVFLPKEGSMEALDTALSEAKQRVITAEKAIKEAYQALTGDKEETDILKMLSSAITSPEFDEIKQQYLDSLYELKESERALLNERADNWLGLADGIGKCMSAIGDIYEDNLAARKKKLEAEGKYDEQEQKALEEEYKNVQAIKIAEATINTIAGALAAFMGWQDKGQPWGAIIGAVQAAAVTAAGIAEIANIARTNPYSNSNSVGSSSFSSVATPTMSDYAPQYTTNVTGESDTDNIQKIIENAQIVVRVSDIDDAQAQNRVRVSESTF